MLETPFRDGVNALCWRRELVGDFAEVLSQLECGGGITGLDEAWLGRLKLSEAGRVAVAAMVADLHRLRGQDLAPELNVIWSYAQEAAPGAVRTDVCSFHVDSAMQEADTWLCTYYGPSSEGLLNEEAMRRMEVPETRAALLREYGGADDGGFAEFCEENCFDLHYAAKGGAQPYAFGVGNLWRIAAEYPGSPVLPCIHRAPETKLGRLLLIA